MPNETNYDINLVGRYHRPYHFNWFSVFAPVVPYVYDGSLSLLEMVHKLLLYINKVNQAVNENHTDIINLAKLVEELAAQCAELPELIARIEELIAMLPPLYLVQITTNGDEATANMSIDEIRAVVADGKIPMAIVDDRIIAIYDAESEAFQFALGNNSTIIGNFTDNVGRVETTAFITENGGTINGILSIINAPVNATDAVNKAYVDEAIEENKAKIVPFTYASTPEEGAPVDINIDIDEVFSEDDVYNVLLNRGNMYFRCVYASKPNKAALFVYFFPLGSGDGLTCYCAQLNGIQNTPKLYRYNLIRSGLLREMYVQKEGDTMTGALVLYGNPINNLDAVPKQYVDELRTEVEGNEPLTVTIRSTAEGYISNYYADEIFEAFSNNKTIICKLGRGNYTLVHSIRGQSLFIKSSRNAVDLVIIGVDSVETNSYFTISNNGNATSNRIESTLVLDYEITEPLEAVNKAYVDELRTEVEDNEPLTVTITPTAEGYSSDYYADEIYEAWSNNKPIICKLASGSYTLVSSTANQSLFIKYSRYSVSLVTIGVDSVEENSYFTISNNGNATSNRIESTLVLDYEITEPLEAVNKAYVDEAIAEIQPIRIIEYDVENGTCELTCAEILELINGGITPIAHATIRGNESWGYLTTKSGNNLRYLFTFDVCKNTVGLKHNYDETISYTEYVYITDKGGEILANKRFTISGILTINGKGTIASVDETNNLSLINKEYLDTALANSVPVVMDTEQSGSGYTLPYTYATLGVMLIRNPYIAIRWSENSDHVEIMYLNGVENDKIIFGNSRYRGAYNTNSVLTITAI